jgi:hypothetical protein
MINETALKAATESAKAKTTDARWLRAIDKAAAKLSSRELIVTLLANDALVTSENGSYRVNGHCNCPATVGHCYHRCAVRLVEMMEAAPAAVPAPAPTPNAGILVRPERGGMRIDGWMV